MVDVAVIGAGINGVTSAYLLRLAGLRVVLYDVRGVAGGGSGAAGAFLSPKFSRSGPLKEIVNSALAEAFDFYTLHAKAYLQKTPLVHIAKNDKEAAYLAYCKAHDDLEAIKSVPPIPVDAPYIYTNKSAIVDAQGGCRFLARDICLLQEEVVSIRRDAKSWILPKGIRAKIVVLATGAYSDLTAEAYMQTSVRGVFGHRIDFASSLDIPCSFHKGVSISPTNDERVCAIGATHNVHMDLSSIASYDTALGRQELLQKARMIFPNLTGSVIRDYVGLRSGSSDYLPIVGKVVDLRATLRALSKRAFESKEQDFSRYVYREDLYYVNASAGYGFVLAPYLARLLVESILTQRPIYDRRVDLARFVARYVRRRL